MSLMQKIEDDYKVALKNRSAFLLEVIRGLKAVIKYYIIDNRDKKLEDTDIIKIIKSEIKKRRDSIELYNAGGRKDLVDSENAEVVILEAFLPKQLSETELRCIIQEIVTQHGSSTKKDLGIIIGKVKEKVGDLADGSIVAKIVKEFCNG